MGAVRWEGLEGCASHLEDVCLPTLAASFSCQSPSTTAGAPTAASIPELDAARSSDKVCQGHSRVQRQQLAAARPQRANETASSKKAAAPPPRRASKSDGSSGAERESTAGGGERERERESSAGGGGNGGGKFPPKAVMASMGVATAEAVRKYEVMALGMLQPATLTAHNNCGWRSGLRGLVWCERLVKG